jgi:NET1-associated nuclear protein 1 (U3 small nucleolar RNA-associated protein 17)
MFFSYIPLSRYTLNTNVEFPHEGLITALEFSSLYNTDNLLCATAGKDNYIKLWSLEDSESIYRKGKVWMCIKKLSYKNLPISSVSFSQDGSLLAAGAGNCLCIWSTDDKFLLKCALTAPSALDGSTNKLLATLPTGNVDKNKSSKVDTQKVNEKRKKILEQMKSLLLKRDTTIMQTAECSEKSRFVTKKADGTRILPRNLSAKEKQVVCRRILGLNELNVGQKVHLCARLGVACRLGVDDDLRRELVARNKGVDIKRQLANMSRERKYEFRRRHSNIMRRKCGSRVSLGKLLNFSGDFSGVQKNLVLENGNSPAKNSFLHLNGHATTNGDNGKDADDPVADKPAADAPLKNLAQINHVLFAHGALCHLVSHLVSTFTKVQVNVFFLLILTL